jgi:tetratricopeptide (TPR) repeat protein
LLIFESHLIAMKIKAILTATLCTLMFISSFAQSELFMEAFREFSTSRLHEFEPIPIDWKMKGTLQADLNEGLNNLLENNPQIAIESLDAVIKADSSIWQAYYYRGAAKKQTSLYKSAEKDMQRALKLRGDFYEGFVELGKIYYRRGMSTESERAINKAIRLDRSRGAAYYIKGDINLAQQEKRFAINNYKDCLAIDSLFHDARIKLALIEGFVKNDVNTSLVHLNKVLAYDSLQKTALLFRSLLVYEKDKRQSVKDLSGVIKVDPNNLMALYYRGVISAELGDYERAFKDFHKVIQQTSVSDNEYQGKQTWLDKKIDLQNAGAYVVTRLYGLGEEDARKIRQAYCQIITGEYDKAIASIEQTSNGRKEPVNVYLKAVAYEHKGEHLKALQNYHFSLVADNTIAEAYKKRGSYRQEMKEWDKSVEDFTAYLKFYPDTYLINRMRGVSHYHMANFQKALDDFNVYLKNDTTNKEVLGFRGMAYQKTNQRLKAYLDFAASDYPDLVNFKDAEKLIDSILVAKDTTYALHCLDILTEGAPSFTEGYVLKFKVHLAREEWTPIVKSAFEALINSRADASKPDHSYLLTVMGMVQSREKQTDSAIKSFGDAIKFNEKNDMAYLERGRLYLSLSKYSKAESDVKKAVALGNPEAKKILMEKLQ